MQTVRVVGALCVLVFALGGIAAGQIATTQGSQTLKPSAEKATTRPTADEETKKILESLQDPKALRKLAEETQNLELRRWLQEREVQLEAQLAKENLSKPIALQIALPPVSLSVNNATLQQAFDALNTIPGNRASFTIARGGVTSVAMTLEARDKSFGEVFRDLCSQQPLTALPPVAVMPDVSRKPESGIEIPLTPARQKLAAIAIDGPAVLLIDPIRFERAIDLQSEAGKKETLRVMTTVLLDPRLIAESVSNIKISATDDDGKTYLSTNRGTANRGFPNTVNVMPHGAAFESSSFSSKKLKINCEMSITIQEEVNSVRVEKVEGRTSAMLDGVVLRIDFTPLRDDAMMCSVNLAGPSKRIFCKLLDADGKIAFVGVGDNNVRMGFIRAQFKAPFTVEVATTRTTRTMPLKFEVNDVALPER